MSIISTALMDEAGRCYAVATTERAREEKRGPAAEVPDAQPN